MKEWRTPELEELDVANTETTYKVGKEKDGNTWELFCYELPLFSKKLCD